MVASGSRGSPPLGVSVIMPAFDAADTIAEAIDSVLKQGFDDLELIVVDDGSKDATAEIVMSIEDDRVQLIQLPANRGVSTARNVGIERAVGRYLAFLDADDMWAANKLQMQVDVLENDELAVATYGLVDRIEADGSGRIPHTTSAPSGELLDILAESYVVGNGSNVMVRRATAVSIGGFDESLGHAEDLEWILRVAQRGRIVGIPEVLVLYRRSPDSLSRNVLEMARAQRAIDKRWRDRLNPGTRRSSQDNRLRYLIGAASSDVRSRRDGLIGLALLARYLVVVAERAVRRERRFPSLQYFLNACRLFLAPFGTSRNPRADELRRTGMISDSFALADPSVLPELVDDEQVFGAALAEIEESGDKRVPYLLTDAIVRTAFDEAIVGVVEQILGPGEPWVMWGANIRRGIPNRADDWHTDTESRLWDNVTVAVGLAGCHEHNATRYIPFTHTLGTRPPGGLPCRDVGPVLASARSMTPAAVAARTFRGFADGRFYVFDAAGWHAGDPRFVDGRYLLFMHYHRAADPRIPAMRDFTCGLWFDEPAAYVTSFDRPGANVDELARRRALDTTLARLPEPPRTEAVVKMLSGVARGGTGLGRRVLRRLRRSVSVAGRRLAEPKPSAPTCPDPSSESVDDSTR